MTVCCLKCSQQPTFRSEHICILTSKPYKPTKNTVQFRPKNKSTDLLTALKRILSGWLTVQTGDIDAGLLRTVPTKRLFRDHEVTIITHAKVKQFNNNAVVIDYNGQDERIAADEIVLAMGYHADNELLKSLQSQLDNVACAGDVIEPTNALEASTSGFKAGYYA